MAEPNPIERRLGRLREQYVTFVQDDQARLLHWVLAEDEKRMMDAFLRVEAISGETGDLLLMLDTPFADPSRYGMDLVAELHELYDAMRDSLAQAGMADTSWRPPAPQPGTPPDVAYLHQTGRSLHEHHQPLLERLSLVLYPARVADPAALTAWLGAATETFDDPAVRLVLVDRAAYPSAGSVQPAAHVRRVEADLDMPGAMEEINADAGLDHPEGRFRQAYLAMGNAMGSGDLRAAGAHAGQAEQIAQAQGWDHLVIATAFALASGQLGHQRHPEAMDGYRRAEAVARRAHEADEPWAQQLVLQSLLGQGSVCVAAASWRLGAQVYAEQAHPVAEAMEDRRMQLETLRMAAYCNEQQGEVGLAWDQCAAALVVGDALAPEDRRTTTLAFVGEAMLRLCEHRSLQGRAPVVDQEMTRQLGPGWRQYAQAGEPPADIDPSQPSPLEASPPPVKTVPESLSRPTPSPASDAEPAGGAPA